MENGAAHRIEGPDSTAVEPIRGEATTNTGELGETAGECIHFTGGSEFNEPLRLRRRKERLPENYKELESKLESLVGCYLGPIRNIRFKATKKYVSQVLRFTDGQHRSRVLKRLAEELPRYPGDLFITCDELNHMHFVHDCPCSNGSCRCRVFKSEEFGGLFRANLRGTRYINELDVIDWYNVLLYFCYSKRDSKSQVWVGGRLRRPTNQDDALRWESLQKFARESVLEGTEAGDGYNCPLDEPVCEISEGFHGKRQGAFGEEEGSMGGSLPRKRIRGSGTTQGVPTKKPDKFQRILSTVSALLDEACVIPPIHMKELFTGPQALELHNPTNQKYYESACALWGMQFNRWTFGEMEQFYQNKEPVFYANDINPWVYYHSREDSFQFVKALLEYQFGDEEDLIREFLINLQDWFNKFGWNKNPKMNCLAVLGPPNSGKNYFFDMFSAIACNVGHIGRVNNKTNQFALQDCVNRRMVVGNEISMEEGAKEDFKKLCEGTALNIRVKFQGDKIFTKAPVLLISNFDLDITYDPHFLNVRLHKMRWMSAELLKHSTLKPYPLCLFDIYKHYNVFLY